MFFQQFETPGLAHYSYLIGEGEDLAVIDPRFDIDIYLDKIEKDHNKKIQFKSKEEFIQNITKNMPNPPYFRKMEKMNLEENKQEILIKPLFANQVMDKINELQIIDTRQELGFGAAHIPGSQFIWENLLPKYGGWLIDYNKPVVIVTEKGNEEIVVRKLSRLGYFNIKGFLNDGMFAWHKAGAESHNIKMISVNRLCEKLDADNQEIHILDIRSMAEKKADGQIKNAVEIELTDLLEKYYLPDKNIAYYIFCGSGMRSMIAASFLKNRGFNQLTVVTGGLKAWTSLKCTIELKTD